jgi:hypothetical protein
MSDYTFKATHIVSNDEKWGVEVQEADSGEVAVLYCSEKMGTQDGGELLVDFMSFGSNMWSWYVSYSE